MAIANWLALLLAPMLALTALGINYALVTPACEQQANVAWLHGVFAASLLLSVLFTALAGRNWQRSKVHQAESRTRDRKRFVALVAILAGALSSLVLVAQWLPLWLLSPCYN